MKLRRGARCLKLRRRAQCAQRMHRRKRHGFRKRTHRPDSAEQAIRGEPPRGSGPQPVRFERAELGASPSLGSKRTEPGAHTVPVDEVRAGSPVRKTQHDDGLADARPNGILFADAGLADVSLPRFRSSAEHSHA